MLNECDKFWVFNQVQIWGPVQKNWILSHVNRSNRGSWIGPRSDRFTWVKDSTKDWIQVRVKSPKTQPGTNLGNGRDNYCPKANGRPCVDFGCTHPTDGLFWGPPIYLSGFFSKYECWVTDSIMPLYHFIFLGGHLSLFVSRGFISLWKVKTIQMANFLNNIFLINIQVISFNFFKCYLNEILKKMI